MSFSTNGLKPELEHLIGSFQTIIDNNDFAAIETLLVDDPNSSELHFLAASYHAEKSDYLAAIAAFSLCIELNAEFNIARFQLCFLAIINNDLETFNHYVGPLIELPSHTYLHIFTKALICILNDQTADAIEYLQEGITLNTENLALNENMKNVIALLSEPKETNGEVSTQEDDDFTNETNSVLLDIYKNKFN